MILLDIYNLDEDDAVAMVMRNMMDKQVVKKNFTKDLGLDPHSKHKDPRNKMELRHQQVTGKSSYPFAF